MRKVILTIFLSVYLVWQIDAQDKPVVPGYMGLKFSMQYQGGINPQWNNIGQSFLPYLSNNIQVGYVISRKYEVGLQYTRIDYSSGFKGYTNKFEDLISETWVSMDRRSFTGNNVTAYIKFFRERKGFIAPLGRYFVLGLGYEYSKDRFRVTNDVNSPIGAPNYTNVQSHDMVITMGVGRNIILFNRMLLTVEGDINVPITAGFRAGHANNNNVLDNVYKYNNAIDVMLVNLFQIKIGIGALVF